MRDPARLRVAGSVLTLAGALIAGIGSTLAWTTVGLRVDTQSVLDLEFRGLDLLGGTTALVVAGLTLGGLVLFRRASGRRAQGRLGTGLLLAGVLIMAMPLSVAIRAEERAVEGMARVAAQSGDLTIEEVTHLVREDPSLAVRSELGPGIWFTLAGGALVVVGTAANLAWTRRDEPFAVEP
jgi:tryptophan-associated transmembrane protein